MKLFKKKNFLYIFIIFILTALFVYVAQTMLMFIPAKALHMPAKESQSSQSETSQTSEISEMSEVQHHRCLSDNYKVLSYFLNLPDRLFNETSTGRTSEKIFSQSDLLKIKDPFIADVIKLKVAEALLEEKNYPRIETLIMSIHNPPHFLEKRITRLRLITLYHRHKYTPFIQLYESSPFTNKSVTEPQILYINSLIKTGAKKKAFETFKNLFLNNHLKPFRNLMSPADLNSFLLQLSSSEWFQKLKYLAEKNFFSEFKKEKSYVKSSQLVNFFNAEFYYKKKQYNKTIQYLGAVDSPILRPYKQKLLIKIKLRRNHYEGVMADIEGLKNDNAIYSEILLDAASILLVQHETSLSLSLFEKYIAMMEETTPEKFPGKTIIDPNYWRANWTVAWLYHRKNHTEKAISYFEKGLQANSESYKIANMYWYYRLKNAASTTTSTTSTAATTPTTATTDGPSPMEEYPFTYYFTKIRDQQSKSEISANDNGLKNFSILINGKQGPMFLQLIGQLKSLLANDLCDESFHFVQWAKTENGLTNSEKNVFKIIESILYLKKKDFFHTFVTFRDNFSNYLSLRLPKFLRGIFCPIRFELIVDNYSKQYNLDRNLVLALIREESFFRPDIISSAKAGGLMQLLYSTARSVARKQGIRIKKWDIYNPGLNIRLGIDYLKGLLDKYDNKYYLALAAYNAGDFRVDEWLQQFGNVSEEEFIEMIPFTETRNYIKNILRNYYYYKFYYGANKENEMRSQGAKAKK